LLLGKNGFGSRNAAASLVQLVGIAQLLRGFLHAQVEMGLLQGLDFSGQAGGVFLAQFSRIHVHLLNYWPIMRATKVVRKGSFAAANLNASRANCSGTPTISYKTLPG
jgi:hypothetical protein